MTGTDVVEQRGDPSRLSRRGRRGAIVLVVLVAAVAAGADWEVRRHETVGIDRCVRGALGSVAVAESRVSMMTRYISPALGSSPPDDLRRGLLDMVSEAALPSVPLVRRARDRCDGVRVLATHTGARRTRADCLRMLDVELSYLAAVGADGRHTFEANGSTRGRCVAR
ncbi:MAG: hypothetical protein ACJ72A_17600 [Nocardioidaceae bacterium]